MFITGKEAGCTQAIATTSAKCQAQALLDTIETSVSDRCAKSFARVIDCDGHRSNPASERLVRAA
eukprot:2886305-Pyramimonas_sp.AAC.1